MNLTFGSRLILRYVVTLGYLLAVTAGILSYTLDWQAKNKFDTALQILGTSEAETILANLQKRGAKTPDKNSIVDFRYREIFNFKNRQLEKYITVVNSNQQAADFSENLNAPLAFDDEFLSRSLAGEVVFQTINVEERGNLRVVYIPVRTTDISQNFVVIIGLPEDFISGDIRFFRLISALAILVLLGLTALSAYFLAKQTMRPIEKVTAAAESLTSKNFQDRIPEPLAEDQIGRLIKVYNQMLARLDDAFESQRRFATRAAHELRTPLTILQGEIQVTLRRRRSIEEYEIQLQSNLEEVEKMTRTVDDLLTFARYESGETEMPRRRVRLDEITASIAKDLRVIAEKDEKRFIVETDEVVEVFGDEQALARLVSNFIENAIFYTPRDGRIFVKVTAGNGKPTLIIEDTGIGIAPEDLPHIFERLFRSQAARQMRPKGVGIGLALAEVISRLHDAEIVVENNSPNGTRFTIYFSPPAVESKEIEMN